MSQTLSIEARKRIEDHINNFGPGEPPMPTFSSLDTSPPVPIAVRERIEKHASR